MRLGFFVGENKGKQSCHLLSLSSSYMELWIGELFSYPNPKFWSFAFGYIFFSGIKYQDIKN